MSISEKSQRIIIIIIVKRASTTNSILHWILPKQIVANNRCSIEWRRQFRVGNGNLQIFIGLLRMLKWFWWCWWPVQLSLGLYTWMRWCDIHPLEYRGCNNSTINEEFIIWRFGFDSILEGGSGIKNKLIFWWGLNITYYN